MLKEAIGVGETVLLAQEDAYHILGVNSNDNVEFEVIQMPVKKTLGLFGGKPAKVRAILKVNHAQVALNYVNNIIEKMGLENITAEAKESESGAHIDLSGEEVGYLIGRRGETLDALQYLAGLACNRGEEKYYRITIDTANYREKREKTLEDLAVRLANKAIRTKKTISLEPMNAYERRIIHAVIQKINGVTSRSEGENKERHVVVSPNFKNKDLCAKTKKAFNAKACREDSVKSKNNGIDEVKISVSDDNGRFKTELYGKIATNNFESR